MDKDWFAGFTSDLNSENLWKEFHASQREKLKLPEKIPPVPQIDGEVCVKSFAVDLFTLISLPLSLILGKSPPSPPKYNLLTSVQYLFWEMMRASRDPDPVCPPPVQL